MITSSQLLSHYLVIGCRAKSFAVEDKFLEPHIQESNMFPLFYSPFFLVLSNVTIPSVFVLGFQMMRRFVILTAKEGVWRRDIQSSQHEDIGQGWSHRPMAEQKTLNASDQK
jgi:hypothetical protein